ncbi:DUF771 domain-containing protein [Lacticaseibacillus nasuensis]|uniref:DUF771 domain-containing protein n=1 Tax=Lacticaseibacillus nasuensis TaxID=944671 RepID=UPI0022473DFB|nr:DUF771 domain-containing protein [Lacticaseibacillus nasuensis]MCX2455664.1 DUF771 domain-containing protein [Lacticaseibacillus nasuensis]
MPDQTIAQILAPLVQAEVDRQLAEREQVVRSDPRKWWTVADVRERYGVSPAWLTDNILAAPRFQRELDGIAANFAGRMGWRFEPTRFGDFMSKHFADIAKEAAR